MGFRYTYKVSHNGLGKYRVVSGTDEAFVKAKALALQNSWEAEYRRKLAKQQEEEDREIYRRELNGNVQEAERRTNDAEKALEQVSNILRAALTARHAIDWEKLKRKDAYSTPQPKELVYAEFPWEPQPEDIKYKPMLTLFDKLSKSRVEQKSSSSKQSLHSDHATWLEAVERVKAENQKLYSKNVTAIERWNEESRKHQEELDRGNAAIDKRKADYESLQPDAVADYCELVLSASEYPDDFPRSLIWNTFRIQKFLLLIIHCLLPKTCPVLKK